MKQSSTAQIRQLRILSHLLLLQLCLARQNAGALSRLQLPPKAHCLLGVSLKPELEGINRVTRALQPRHADWPLFPRTESNVRTLNSNCDHHLTFSLASQRARSSSRKRGHDDNDNVDRSGPLPPYYHNFASPGSAHNNSSPHSSPASVNLPSPNMAVLEPPQEASPQLTNNTLYNYGAPISPVQNTSPPRYEFDYGMHSGQSSSQTWNNGHGDRRSLEAYPTSPQESTLYHANSYGTYTSSLDPTYAGYETRSDMGGSMTNLSTTPPTASFAATGLPFHGLDFIRNYNPGGYPLGDQDSLWQSYDPGAFGYDPDLPFHIGDLPDDAGQDMTH